MENEHLEDEPFGLIVKRFAIANKRGRNARL
jgi:hypothetical protein